MAGTVERLQPVGPLTRNAREGAGPDHPMRKVTAEVAFDAGWSAGRARTVAELFDGLAHEWHTRDEPGRLDSLYDALDRGGLDGYGRCLEVGSGTGLVTPALAGVFDSVTSVDLAGEMLRLAPADVAPRVQADSNALPFPDAAFHTVLHVNALLFPAEVDRVLAPGGAVVWVCTRGDETPIYLDAEDVVRALPGEWEGSASAAGYGTWAVLRRKVDIGGGS